MKHLSIAQVIQTWWRALYPIHLSKHFTHNLGPKVLSLLIAFTLWYAITADRRVNIEQGFDVPVTIRDSIGGDQRSLRATSGLTPASIRVTLSGRPERLRNLGPENIQATVDVTDVVEGSFTEPVKVLAPEDTVVVRQSATKVQGFLDTEMIRTLPISLSVLSSSDTSLPRYTLSPTDASVRGPSRIIAQVKTLITSPIALAANTETEIQLLALDDKGEPISGVKTTPTVITVKRVDTGKLPIKAVRVVLNAPPKTLKVTKISILPSNIRVVAEPDLLSNLNQIKGQIIYRVGSYTAPVTLTVPRGVQVLEPASVRLTVEKAK